MTENKDFEYISYSSLLIITFITIILAFVGLGLVIDYNEAFYVENVAVRIVFTLITDIGETLVFIILVAVVYIVYDKRFAKNLAFSLLITVFFNGFFKDLFKDPRPPTNTTTENPLGYTASGYGFPSGHSQSAVGFWGYMAYGFKDKSKPYLIPTILSILIGLIALSRVIIGVHDLQDIVGGLIIGVGVLLAFIYSEPYISSKVNNTTMNMRILISVAFSLVIFLGGTFISMFIFQVEDNLFTDTGAYAQVGGVMLGLSIGYILENEYVGYEPSKISTKDKVFNLVVGIVILVLTFFSLELLKGFFDSFIFRYIRYGLIAFILAFVVPLIFTKVNKSVENSEAQEKSI